MDLENSARTLLRATYTPVQLPGGVRPGHGRPRAFEKAALISYIGLSRKELAEARAKARTDGERRTADGIGKLLGESGPTTSGAVKPFGAMGFDDLCAVVSSVLSARRKDLELISKSGPVRLQPAPSGAQQALGFASARVILAEQVLAALKHQVVHEPVGFLHLEKINFVPSGIERGELAYSVPLSPAEEVNITHREWSTTAEEFSTLVTDSLEQFSEQGVAEKSDLTQSTQAQQQHASGFNTAVTASGGYGGVTVTASAGYSASDSSSNSEQSARSDSLTLTRKASSRAKKEYKVSFRVASAAGTEDQAVRTIRNPFADKATRVDYYQLIRRWRVDLLRYGLRLTYDLVVPEPGSEILSRIKEVEALREELSRGFDYDAFEAAVGELTPTNFLDKAAIYGAVIDPPPPATISLFVTRSQEIGHGLNDTTKNFSFTAFNVEIPEKYAVESAGKAHVEYDNFSKDDGFNASHHAPKIVDDLNKKWKGLGGKLQFIVKSKLVMSYVISMTVTASLRAEALEAWQLKSRDTLRQAAKQRYEEARQYLPQRLAALLEALGGEDALSLRKIEREEVMKAVMRWLFGPKFVFVPANMPADLYDDEGKIVDGWRAPVAIQGDLVKLIHQAIEWENMMYFLYPYFWSHPSRWELKKYLEHPDAMHRAFLRAGSARVVLTIRPGYEKQFLSFLETSEWDGLPASDQYMTIVDEMQAYANTNYPGIPAANLPETRPLLHRRQREAWDDMQALMRMLEAYTSAHKGAYPSTSQGLASLQPYLESGMTSLPLVDPWGNPYAYTSPGEHAQYDLVSFGADGAAGGEGEDKDIASWAEASLIGSWFEYTPTPALDVAFNETSPNA